jgi:N-acetylglucosaminyldiphosphoundecaprenol N-acetyl-beta-D-mannosaminyltransferase
MQELYMRVSPDRLVSIFDIEIINVSIEDAIGLLAQVIEEPWRRSHSVYFVNADTVNLASGNQAFRHMLQRGDFLFGDGTGVRWAARFLREVRLRANINGNDLIEPFLTRTAGRGYRYYLLGSTEEIVERAAGAAQERFPGWELAGFHHGYFDAALGRELVARINEARPHLLLVGMGQPLQESWIHQHLHELRVPLCAGIGGLFNYWAGDRARAPMWVRKLGSEWAYILIHQPNKLGRYVLGNPRFLARLVRHAWRAKRARR